MGEAKRRGTFEQRKSLAIHNRRMRLWHYLLRLITLITKIGYPRYSIIRSMLATKNPQSPI